MKLSDKMFLALSFLFLSLFSQVAFGMKTEPKKEIDDEMGKIIFIAGISSSGKSTISKIVVEELKKTHDENRIKYVAPDDFDTATVEEEERSDAEQNSRLEADQRLAIKMAKELASDSNIVICDIVPLNSLSQLILHDIKDQTKYYPTYTILIHTPLTQIIQQAKKRNTLIKKVSADEDDNARHLRDPLEQFARSYKDADKTGAKSPKSIPERLSSPELEEQCAQFTPPSSPLGNRLFYAFEENLLPNKKQEVFYITPIEEFDYIFQNNKFNAHTGKPSLNSIKILVFAIEEWLKTATAEWEKALDDNQKSDDEDELTEVNSQSSSSSSSSQQKQKTAEKKAIPNLSDDETFDNYFGYSDDDELDKKSSSSSQQKQTFVEKKDDTKSSDDDLCGDSNDINDEILDDSDDELDKKISSSSSTTKTKS